MLCDIYAVSKLNSMLLLVRSPETPLHTSAKQYRGCCQLVLLFVREASFREDNDKYILLQMALGSLSLI